MGKLPLQPHVVLGRFSFLPFNLSLEVADHLSTFIPCFATYMDQKYVTGSGLGRALRITHINAVTWIIIYIFFSLCESTIVAHRNQQ